MNDGNGNRRTPHISSTPYGGVACRCCPCDREVRRHQSNSAFPEPLDHTHHYHEDRPVGIDNPIAAHAVRQRLAQAHCRSPGHSYRRISTLGRGVAIVRQHQDRAHPITGNQRSASGRIYAVHRLATKDAIARQFQNFGLRVHAGFARIPSITGQLLRFR